MAFVRAREEKTLAKLFAWEALLKLAEADTHAKEAKIARLTCQLRVALRAKRYRRGWSTTTVTASILQSFDFIIAAFTAPARQLLTPAAAQERMIGAPSGTATHSHFGSFNIFAVAMANGVAQRSKAGWRARR